MFDFLCGRGLPCWTGAQCSTSRLNAGGRSAFGWSCREASLTDIQIIKCRTIVCRVRVNLQVLESDYVISDDAFSSLAFDRLLPTFSCFLSSSPSCPLCVLWNYSSSHGLIISHYYWLSPLVLSSWSYVCVHCTVPVRVYIMFVHTCLTLIKNGEAEARGYQSIKRNESNIFIIFPRWCCEIGWNFCFPVYHTNLQQYYWFTVSGACTHVSTHSIFSWFK